MTSSQPHQLSLSARPPVTTVVVMYNSRDVVGAALEGVARAREEGLSECIVIDNASADGSAEFVRERFPWVTVVADGRNVGFGRGCNQGLLRATTPYVLFLNPDAVVDPTALRTLVGFMDTHPRAVFAVPATKVSDAEHLQVAGGLPTAWNHIGRVLNLRVAERRPVEPGGAPFQTDWLCGGILLGRRDMLNELGGFDPRFFLYFEETDLCRRALERGMELWAVGEAVARHVGGVSAKATKRPLCNGCIAEHYFQSRYYYLCKHDGRIAGTLAELTDLGVFVARALARALLGRSRGELRERLRAPILSMPKRVVEPPGAKPPAPSSGSQEARLTQ